MVTATDDNTEIRNLDARLFKKSTCWHTSTFELAIEIKAAGNLNNNFSRLYIMILRSKAIQPLA